MAESHSDNVTRRDFLYVGTAAFAGVGGAMAAWPLINQMNPSASVLAVATTEVDLAPIPVGQMIKVLWQGKPVFVRHRTDAEIKAAVDTAVGELKDPQTDAERVQRAPWLILLANCPHLGCVPTGYEGPYNGWFCPCHGSEYDTSGRIRKGPSPKNLQVPPYTFLSDTRILIG